MSSNKASLEKEKRKTMLVWAVLMLMTLTGYFSSEDWFTGRNLAIVLMLVTAIKFLGVSFYFMEIKNAHPAWKWVLGLVLTVFSLLVVFTTG
jgi:hypothetical protein